MRMIGRFFYLALFLALAGPSLLHAQQPPAPQSAEAREQEIRAASQAAAQAGTRGPADVPLLDQATLRLPVGMMFVPPAQATRLLRALGNRVVHDPVGLVYSTNKDDDWFVVVRFNKDGYIKDDDARDWDAGDLLKSLREGTEESNKDRVARGFRELEIIGWIAPPKYDSNSHRLVWSLAQKGKGEPTPPVQGVNYNIDALGREGYFSFDLVTDTQAFPTSHAAADTLLSALSFNSGKRYEDFNVGTDHIAEYGLAALIGVVAAKKLGLLALAGVFVLKFAKIGAVLLAGGAAVIAKLFGGRKSGGNA